MGIAAHVDSGKTTLTEHMLFAAGRRPRVGRVDSGSTVTDFLPQERERGITIQSAAVRLDWDDHEIYLIDTPGHVDFGFEVERSLGVLDGVVLVVDAVAGAQARTGVVWKLAKERNLPVIVFVNKMDRLGADFDDAVRSLRRRCGPFFVPIQRPRFRHDNDDLRDAGDFVGADELDGPGFDENDDDDAKSFPTKENLSSSSFSPLRLRAAEMLADLDDDAAEVFLEDEARAAAEVKRSLRRATLRGTASPVLCGAALKGIGVRAVLDAVVDYLPAPPEEENSFTTTLRALAFKVTKDPRRGTLVFLRVYDGELRPKQALYNRSQRNKRERATSVMRPFADDFEPLAENEAATNGDVVVVVGLRYTVAGDTLSSDDAVPLLLEGGMVPPAPVFARSVEPAKASDFEDLTKALDVLTRDDPSLAVHVDDERLVLSGMGELHLEVAKDRLLREYRIEATFGTPTVELRESVDEKTTRHSSRYDRTVGAKRLSFGVTLSVEPAFLVEKNDDEENDDSQGINSRRRAARPPRVSLSEVARGKLQKEPETEAALVSAFTASRGPLRGHALSDLEIRVDDVDLDEASTPGAARACAVQALNEILRTAHPVVLEPVMRLDLRVPDARLGDVLADLALKPGAAVLAVRGDDDHLTEDKRSRVEAHVPLAALLGYASAVRSLTAGDADFNTDYAHHAARVGAGGAGDTSS